MRLLHGDCLAVLPTLEAESIDAVVTDPPYGLEFMGKEWDGSDGFRRSLNAADVGREDVFGRSSARAPEFRAGPLFQQWCEAWARECLRVLKPGGHLLAFGGTRTYHRMACAVEDAGFEIRDQIQWLYGTGFPKSKNLRGEHEGRGTALKPANEPIVLARKPLVGTVEENVRRYGTGALNIDGCRIGAGEGGTRGGEESAQRRYADKGSTNFAATPGPRGGDAKGRWPANVVHDGSDEVLAVFPDAPGQLRGVGPANGPKPSVNTYGDFGPRDQFNPRGDSGSAARFFYCAKATRRDRNEGCEALPDVQGGMVSNTSGQHITRRDGGAPGMTKNNHPTVKPTTLMRYLCRLVTPAGGLILDPFAGSGSTGKAALLEGFRFVGIEQSAAYVEIARARIDHVVREMFG